MNDVKAICDVCPHRCAIAIGRVGICRARGNVDGRVESLNYGQATALSLDPIEKKPFARFHPDSMILSYGSYGCNLRCAFCQNSDISMAGADACGNASLPTRFISPEQLVEEALGLKARGNIGVAITYNEPLIASEFIVDTGSLCHGAGLCLALVSNGYANEDVFDKAMGVTDAINIDLKCFSEEGYGALGAPDGLCTVKRNIETAVDSGVHVEVTTLVVPGISDSPQQFEGECAWLASLDRSIPLHISRFFPQYKMTDAAPTDVALMLRFRSIAERYLDNVYLGNV